MVADGAGRPPGGVWLRAYRTDEVVCPTHPQRSRRRGDQALCYIHRQPPQNFSFSLVRKLAIRRVYGSVIKHGGGLAPKLGLKITDTHFI